MAKLEVDYSQAIDTMPAKEARLLCHRLLADIRKYQAKVARLEQIEQAARAYLAADEKYDDCITFRSGNPTILAVVAEQAEMALVEALKAVEGSIK